MLNERHETRETTDTLVRFMERQAEKPMDSR